MEFFVTRVRATFSVKKVQVITYKEFILPMILFPHVSEKYTKNSSWKFLKI